MSKVGKKRKSKPFQAKVKVEAPRLLGRSTGYVSDPKYSLGQNSRYGSEALTIEDAGPPPEPESVDKDTQKWITKEAHERDEARNATKPLAVRVAALEKVARRDQLLSLEKRIKQVERATSEKAA